MCALRLLSPKQQIAAIVHDALNDVNPMGRFSVDIHYKVNRTLRRVRRPEIDVNEIHINAADHRRNKSAGTVRLVQRLDPGNGLITEPLESV